MVKARVPKPSPSSDCRGLESSLGPRKTCPECVDEPSSGQQGSGSKSESSSLLVRFGGVELGSGLRVAGRAVGDGCVDAPRRTSTLP